MATISTADFRNGMCIRYNNKLYTIIEFQHVKPGKGSAFVRTKLRDLNNGRVIDNTFNAGVKLESERLEQRTKQYLYNDGVDFYFMDMQDYDQMTMPAETVGDVAKWLKENDEVTLLYAGDKLISLEPPMFVELEIIETEPGFKGDTVQSSPKPATLETGAVVNVPMYLNNGDVVKVDTRTGQFVSRV